MNNKIILQKIECSERLPSKNKYYYTEFGELIFNGKHFESTRTHGQLLTQPKYWYEAIDSQELAKERYVNALNSLGESHWNSAIQSFDDLCRILRIAAGLKE